MTTTTLKQKVTLPPSDKPHNRLALGCWQFGGSHWGKAEEDSVYLKIMQHAWDMGLRHWDTAFGYGMGKSEALIGEFLQGKDDSIFLATKGFPSADINQFKDQFNSSLKNLGREFDLYYMHWPSRKADMRPHFEFLEEQRQKGKFKVLGVSNFTVDHLKKTAEVADINVYQLGYHLLWRHREQDVIAYCMENGIKLVSYSSIGQGILTGKFSKDVAFEEKDNRNDVIHFREDVWPHVHAAVEELKQLADSVNRPLTHLAIRWVLAQPHMTSVIVGARSISQLEQNVAALEGDIPDSIFAEMTAISDRTMPLIPDVNNLWGNVV